MPKRSPQQPQIDAEAALEGILERVASIAHAFGISITQLEGVLRRRAVIAFSKRSTAEIGRVSVSRIAAQSGLSRAVVTAILKSNSAPRHVRGPRPQYPNRVLSGWHRDPRYSDDAGLPRTLPIYGKGTTFERLTKKYGGGIPVRAILDELLQSSAVELLPESRVRAKSMWAANQISSRKGLQLFGERISQLMDSAIHNISSKTEPKFIASVETIASSASELAYLRRVLNERASVLISELEDTILSPKNWSRKSRALKNPMTIRVGLGVYCFDDADSQIHAQSKSSPRRNLRRLPKRLT